MNNPVLPFDWHRIWLSEYPSTYLGEVALRTVFMFVVILTALSISGKREVRQLSVYELVLLIGLGSAAGDPMLYHDVPLGAAVVVFRRQRDLGATERRGDRFSGRIGLR